MKSSGLKKYTTEYDSELKKLDDDDDDKPAVGGSTAAPVLSLADQMNSLKSKPNPKGGLINDD